MKTLSFAILVSLVAPTFAQAAPDAAELVKKAEFHIRGKSAEVRMNMSVIRGSSERKLEAQVWTEGTDKAVVKIVSPEKDRGTGNLRLKFDLWQYLPNLERTVKIPPSMMLQSWMGSDFTNDDLVKTSSFSRDYTSKLLGEEVLNGSKAYKIECLPKKDAAVTWGKVILWLRNPDAATMKSEYYSENGELVKTLIGTEIKNISGHMVATHLSMKMTRKPENETRIQYSNMKFDQPIVGSTFTQEFLKKRAK